MKVVISGNEFSFEQEIESGRAKELVRVLLRDDEKIKKSLDRNRWSRSEKSMGMATEKVEIRLMIRDSQAKRIPDKIVVVGVWLREAGDQMYFEKRDVIRAFEQVGEAVPKNLPRDLRRTEKLGWIAERTERKGSYYVTAVGERALGEMFSGEKVKRR